MTRSQSPPHLALVAHNKISRGTNKKRILRNKLNLAIDQKKVLELEIQELKMKLRNYEEHDYCEVVKVNTIHLIQVMFMINFHFV